MHCPPIKGINQSKHIFNIYLWPSFTSRFLARRHSIRFPIIFNQTKPNNQQPHEPNQILGAINFDYRPNAFIIQFNTSSHRNHTITTCDETQLFCSVLIVILRFARSDSSLLVAASWEMYRCVASKTTNTQFIYFIWTSSIFISLRRDRYRVLFVVIR